MRRVFGYVRQSVDHQCAVAPHRQASRSGEDDVGIGEQVYRYDALQGEARAGSEVGREYRGVVDPYGIGIGVCPGCDRVVAGASFANHRDELGVLYGSRAFADEADAAASRHIGPGVYSDDLGYLRIGGRGSESDGGGAITHPHIDCAGGIA